MIVDIAIRVEFVGLFDKNASINMGIILNSYCVVGVCNSGKFNSLNVTTSHVVISNATRDLGTSGG